MVTQFFNTKNNENKIMLVPNYGNRNFARGGNLLTTIVNLNKRPRR